jgi:SDR family mycofactocin-dependent oxidoreductase
MPTALVTGAARGIGAATVRLLLATGWDVVALDRAEDDPAFPYPLATPTDLQRLGVPCVRGDARDAAAVAAAVALAETTYGGLDAVVAAAGVVSGGVPLWEQDPAQTAAILAVDLGSVLTLAQVAIPALLRRPPPRAGRFVAVASAAATRGLPMLAAYCAAKAGVTGLVRALAVELQGTGITANAVSPGSTDTDVLLESARLYDVPVSELGTQQDHILAPAEVAAAICWLLSPAASGVTGVALPVDAGMAV